MPDATPPPGTTIRATVGTPFSVTLRSAATGGYQWHPQVPTILEPAGHRREAGVTGVGGAAPEVFDFLPSAPGVGVLQFALKRAWEATPQQTLEYTVEVT
jgi:hypothetical protein